MLFSPSTNMVWLWCGFGVWLPEVRMEPLLTAVGTYPSGNNRIMRPGSLWPIFGLGLREEIQDIKF
jgi:hypothetical protein